MPTKRNQALSYLKVPPFLRQLREAAGLTQRQLAKKLGESQWWVHRSEIGSRRVDVVEFARWSTGCGTDPDTAIRELTGYGR